MKEYVRSLIAPAFVVFVDELFCCGVLFLFSVFRQIGFICVAQLHTQRVAWWQSQGGQFF